MPTAKKKPPVARADAATKKKRGKSKAKRPRITSTIFWPSTFPGAGPDGSDLVLPPLVDAVIDMMLSHSRASMVATLTERYRVKLGTIDRAIAAAKDTAPDEWTMTRGERMKRNYQRLIRNYYKAGELKQMSASNGAIREASKLAGDMKPDVIVMGVDMEADVLEAEAKELERIAARRRGA